MWYYVNITMKSIFLDMIGEIDQKCFKNVKNATKNIKSPNNVVITR